MDINLYETKLVKHKIFKDVKSSLTENFDGKLRNVLELKDDVLYVWNAKENCLYSLNLRHLEKHDDTPYQKLCFSVPPSFSVERVVASHCGSKVCVWGSRGVTVVDLPLRWGRGGLFDNGKLNILCKSYPLDEKFLYMQGDVRRVQWHPTSLSHILVLVSDNTLRLYNIAHKSGPKLEKTFPIGPKPSALLAGRTILDSLGDTAVDFCPTPDRENLLILRGNGDVYMMKCDVENEIPSDLKLSDPLVMYPPADDNYGSESCSILALGGGDTPPVVIVAACSGQLYHCLLLPNSSDGNDEDGHALYVLEAVQLDILLNADDELQNSYPLHLHPCSSWSYAVSHAGGLHAVSLHALRYIRDYALADEAESECLLSAIGGAASGARHAARTRGPGRAAGVAVTSPPLPAALVLCADGTLLPRILQPFNLEEQLFKELQLKNPALEQEDINKIMKERQKLSFTEVIQQILTRDSSQPILNMNKNTEISNQESLELLTEATVKLRTEYMSRQHRAMDALATRLGSLRAIGELQRNWNKDLQKEIENVRVKIIELKQKCALAEKHQDDIKYRCSTIIRNLRVSTTISPAERELLTELEFYKRTGERMVEQITLLKEHVREKSIQLEKWQEDYKKKNIALGKSHSETISSILQQQTGQITSLIEEAKLLKDQLGLV